MVIGATLIDIGAVMGGVMSYEADALANAISQELTSAEVEAMGYAEIIELAEVTLDGDGNPPADFFYQTVRTYVVSQLEELEAQAQATLEENTVKAWILLSPSDCPLKGKDVYRNDDDELVIK